MNSVRKGQNEAKKIINHGKVYPKMFLQEAGDR